MHGNEPEFHRKIIVSNETRFHLGGYFNKQNCRIWGSDPRTWELAAPTIVPTSSWLLPRSTAIGWLNEEDPISSRHLWWGPPALTFWDHWALFF